MVGYDFIIVAQYTRYQHDDKIFMVISEEKNYVQDIYISLVT